MSLNRRRFLKLAAASSVAMLAGEARASNDDYAINCDETYGVLVDTVVCIGCRKCEWACNNEHKLSSQTLAAFEDKSVFVRRRRPNHAAYTVVNAFTDPAKPDRQYAIKVQCLHCNRPACVSACIVGALQKSRLGSVDYDAWKCIGCRYCMVACPFQIPAYDFHEALKPEVRKCTFCSHRLNEGKKPACVAICPNEALTFGTRAELIDVATGRIRANPDRYFDYIYGEQEVGGTSWMYLAPADFVNTELPRLGSAPIPVTTESIQHGIFKSFVPPLALYGILGMIMHMTRESEAGQE